MTRDITSNYKGPRPKELRGGDLTSNYEGPSLRELSSGDITSDYKGPSPSEIDLDAEYRKLPPELRAGGSEISSIIGTSQRVQVKRKKRACGVYKQPDELKSDYYREHREERLKYAEEYRKGLRRKRGNTD
jgi:hypothetical protein